MRGKNVLLGVARTSNTQVAAMLREKSFFQKHNKSLFGDKFTEDMTEIIQARKQSIYAIIEVNRPINRQLFQKGRSYQNKVGGG